MWVGTKWALGSRQGEKGAGTPSFILKGGVDEMGRPAPRVEGWVLSLREQQPPSMGSTGLQCAAVADQQSLWSSPPCSACRWQRLCAVAGELHMG